MKRLVALSLLAIVALAGCSKPKPVVVLDSWWSAGAAKRICESAKTWVETNKAGIAQIGCDKVKACPDMMARAQACSASPTGGLEAFEAKIADQLTKCAGIQFVQFRYPGDQQGRTGQDIPQWQLMIEYDPIQTAQVYTLTGPASQYVRASATADDIAAQVCRAAGAGQG